MDEKKREELLKKIEEYDEIIKLDPNNALNYYYRGECYYSLNKYINSFHDFEKVIKLKKELQEYGLLEEVRQGLNKPNLLYLGNIDYQALPTEETHSNPSATAEMSKRHFQKNQGNVKITSQKMSKRHANDTENNETELSNDTNRYKSESSLSDLSISV